MALQQLFEDSFLAETVPQKGLTAAVCKPGEKDKLTWDYSLLPFRQNPRKVAQSVHGTSKREPLLSRLVPANEPKGARLVS